MFTLICLKYIPDGTEYAYQVTWFPNETRRQSIRSALYNLGNGLKTIGRRDIVSSPDSDCDTRIVCSRDEYETLTRSNEQLVDNLPQVLSSNAVPMIAGFPLVAVDELPEFVMHPNAKKHI